MSARKKMRLEGGGSSSNEMLLEPSATINDLPSEVMKNIFSFVGKGNYYFIGPVSKDFCFNYLTMDVIEDEFAHKMDYLQAIGKNKVTTAEAISTSFELAEYCFFKAPEDFQKQVVKKAILKGRKNIVNMGHAMGIDIDKIAGLRHNVEKIAEQGDLEMIKLLYEKSSLVSDKVVHIIQAAARNNQLGVLKWMKKFNFIKDRYCQRALFLGATKSGNLETVKWAKETTDSNFQHDRELINYAVGTRNIELVKYVKREDISWNESTFRCAASIGDIAMLQYLFENECPHEDPKICTNAIKENDHEKSLEVLQWLHEHDIPWDEITCIKSARLGNLKALKYARLNGCPWNKYCLEAAVQHRNLDVVEYCLQNNCPMGNRDICILTMWDKDHDRVLKMLKLLRKFSVPWSAETCEVAASQGHLQALKWAITQGCHWDRQQCAYDAVDHGDIEFLKWMKSRGCQWDVKTGELAAYKGHLETLKFLRSQGCPCNENTFLGAVRSENFAMIEYCVENDFPFHESLYIESIRTFRYPIPIIKILRNSGYPWHPSACAEAADDNNLRLLRWLRFSGCPWDESVCNNAVINDNLDILRYAHENGCNWTKESYAYCFGEEGLDEVYEEIPTKNEIACSEEIFQYIEDNNCPKPDPNDWYIV